MNNKGKFNNSRGFGVEIEFLRPREVSREDIANAIEARTNIHCLEEEYNHTTRTYWKLVNDSSVYTTISNWLGHNEIVSPILYGADGLSQLKLVLDVLNDLDCKVNRNCGIHIHHDVTEKMIEGKKEGQTFLMNLIKFVAKYEHLIYKLVAPSRLDDRRYSTPVRREYFNGMDKLGVRQMVKMLKQDCDNKYRYGNELGSGMGCPNVQYSRGCGLNLRNVWTRGSVEFRYHNGSLNFGKIANWIVITQAIVNTVEGIKSVQMNYVPNDVERGLWRLRKALGFVATETDTIVNCASSYMLKRYKQLSAREVEYNANDDYRNFVQDGLETNMEVI